MVNVSEQTTMSTLSRLEENFVTALINFDGREAQIKAIAEYIDARISIAIRNPVPIIAQSVCPCRFENGKFTFICAIHEQLLADERKKVLAKVVLNQKFGKFAEDK